METEKLLKFVKLVSTIDFKTFVTKKEMEAFRNAKVVEVLPDRKILEGKSGDRVIRFIVDSKLGKENKTFLNNAYFIED